jgi:hypothetical protein
MQAPANGQIPQQGQQQVVYMQAPANGQPAQPYTGQVAQPGIMAGSMPQPQAVSYEIPRDTSQPAILSGEGADGGINHPSVQINTDGGDVYDGAITDEQRAYENNPPAKHWKCAIFTLCIYLFFLFKALCSAIAVCVWRDDFGDLCGTSATSTSSTFYGSFGSCVLQCEFPCNCAGEGWSGDAWWFLALGFYLFYLSEAYCCSSTRKYVGNIVNLDAITKYFSTMRQTAPVITWHIECYHYRTRRTKNGTRRTKVVTHRAHMNYQYRAWRDVSPAIDGLENYGLTKMQFNKTFIFGNQQTSADYETRKNQFIWANKRDVHQNFWMVHDIAKFEARMLCEGAPGAVGSMISANMYNLFTFLTFSWFYRKWLDGKCARKAHTWVKEISV